MVILINPRCCNGMLILHNNRLDASLDAHSTCLKA